jgi:hypothetical protein
MYRDNDIYVHRNSKEAQTYLTAARERGVSNKLMIFLVDSQVEHGYALRYKGSLLEIDTQEMPQLLLHYNGQGLPEWTPRCK